MMMVWKMNKILNWIFGKKEEEKLDPRDIDHAQIVFTQEAVENETFDDYNKEIVFYKNGFRIRSVPFSLHEIKVIKEINRLPIWDRTADNGEEFKFEEIEALSGELTLTQEG